MKRGEGGFKSMPGTTKEEEESKMRLAIVDDDTGFIKKVEMVIEDYCRKAGETATVRLFSDGGILLEGTGQGRGYDAYILDVEMPRLDGMELARRIREREEDADIIFLSGFEKYALPAYKVRAYDYIMKERYKAEIPAILDRIRAEKQRRNQEDYYTIQTAGMMERLPIDEIRYLTKEKKYVVFYGKEGQMSRERTTLEKVYEKLPHERFLYVNKGCIINMKHIISLKSEIVTLDNKAEHVISRLMARNVREEVVRYLGKMK